MYRRILCLNPHAAKTVFRALVFVMKFLESPPASGGNQLMSYCAFQEKWMWRIDGEVCKWRVTENTCIKLRASTESLVLGKVRWHSWSFPLLSSPTQLKSKIRWQIQPYFRGLGKREKQAKLCWHERQWAWITTGKQLRGGVSGSQSEPWE